MQLTGIHIKNFKYIQDMDITDIENALILVGKNNTGKSAVLDAIRAVDGSYAVRESDFNESRQNIEISISIKFSESDFHMLHKSGMVSQYKRYEVWYEDFLKKLPSCHNGVLSFTCIINQEKKIKLSDGFKKHNKYILEVYPKLYFIDTQREIEQLQQDLLMFQEDVVLKKIRSGCCMFDSAKACRQCFSCIGLIDRKTPSGLNVFEAEKLLEYKLYKMNLSDFEKKVNYNFHKNGGFLNINYQMNLDVDEMLKVEAHVWNSENDKTGSIGNLGKGMRSIYMLSLLEAYVDNENQLPSIIIVEDPEIFLHPQLQKMAGETLYRLSKKNQVIFTTYSPNLLFNFNSRQIKQIILDREHYSVVNKNADIDIILDDLGYAANDFLNVSFVFIVEGKQDKNRLPLLLKKYYSEIYDKEGKLSRISIITTNSCTNIKTYANLKYINQVYLRDQFLMIRDGDGKDAKELAGQLCRYYEERNFEDADKLPKVTFKNVLILKYYSFENYFLNPAVMAKLGVIENEEAFYEILFSKWQEYLHRIKSGKHLTSILGFQINSIEQLKEHMEEIKIYIRGHNLFDIFYGPYKADETRLLEEYINLAPREDFGDILDSIDKFVYFDNRRKSEF